jgi:multidrug efflux pump subunit AcrA (membrane-fusion protein)
MTAPFDFGQAVAAARRAAEAQKAGEQAVRESAADLAEKERLYRKALAQAIVQQHADGAAWTVAQDLARGVTTVADLRYERDVAKGVLDAAEQRAWRGTADRKDMHLFCDWSKRRELAEGYGDTSAIGGRV